MGATQLCECVDVLSCVVLSATGNLRQTSGATPVFIASMFGRALILEELLRFGGAVDEPVVSRTLAQGSLVVWSCVASCLLVAASKWAFNGVAAGLGTDAPVYCCGLWAPCRGRGAPSTRGFYPSDNRT